MTEATTNHPLQAALARVEARLRQPREQDAAGEMVRQLYGKPGPLSVVELARAARLPTSAAAALATVLIDEGIAERSARGIDWLVATGALKVSTADVGDG